MQNLKNSFASFWKYRYLLQNLITRDFKLKYRRSVLGVAWSVLNPLLTCLVMWAVFGALFNQRGDGIEDFPLFLIIGQLMFNFFRESTSMAMESVLKNGPLLRKVYIPKYIFPLEKCCFALVNFFFSLVALFFVALVTWSHCYAVRFQSGRWADPVHDVCLCARYHAHLGGLLHPAGIRQCHFL